MLAMVVPEPAKRVPGTHDHGSNNSAKSVAMGPRLRGDDGSLGLIAPRAVPIEAPAQAAANDVGLQVDAVSRHERAPAEIDVKVFRLAAKARREGIFDARAPGPARLGLGAAQDRDRRGDGTSDVAGRRTAADPPQA